MAGVAGDGFLILFVFFFPFEMLVQARLVLNTLSSSLSFPKCRDYRHAALHGAMSCLEL